MTKTLAALAAAFTLAGCASVLQSSDRNVLVEHGAGDTKSAVVLADQHCQKQGLRARLDQMNCPWGCVSQFRCE